MKKELHLQFHRDMYRSIDVEIYGDEVHFAIDAPWAGSTESGFGQNLSATLDREEAIRLARAILKCYGEPDAASSLPSSTKEKS